MPPPADAPPTGNLVWAGGGAYGRTSGMAGGAVARAPTAALGDSLSRAATAATRARAVPLRPPAGARSYGELGATTSAQAREPGFVGGAATAARVASVWFCTDCGCVESVSSWSSTRIGWPDAMRLGDDSVATGCVATGGVVAATGEIAVGAVAAGGVAAELDVPGGVAPGPAAPGSLGPGDV